MGIGRVFIIIYFKVTDRSTLKGGLVIKKKYLTISVSMLVFESLGNQLNISGFGMSRSVSHLDCTVLILHQPILVLGRYYIVKVAW